MGAGLWIRRDPEDKVVEIWLDYEPDENPSGEPVESLPNIVLGEAQLNELVVAWLRGPQGPPGPAGPAGEPWLGNGEQQPQGARPARTTFGGPNGAGGDAQRSKYVIHEVKSGALKGRAAWQLVNRGVIVAKSAESYFDERRCRQAIAAHARAAQTTRIETRIETA
jgi:hypothetical protein